MPKTIIFIWLIAIALLQCFYTSVVAHPGYGIVTDNSGNIYFTDISRERIWKLDVNNSLQVIETGRWSHQLCIDNNANLYFTDEENINGQSGYSLWMFSAGGNLTELIPASLRKDFPNDVFAIDKDGRIYLATNTAIFRSQDYRHFQALSFIDTESPEKKVTFSGIRSMSIETDNRIYVVDGDKLRCIRDGQIETIISDLIVENPSHIPIKNAPNPDSINRLFGLTLDMSNNIYICYFGNRQVLRISNTGELNIYYQSESPWSPVGVVYDEQGLIVKEHGFLPKVGWIGPRILRIKKDGERLVLAELKG